jgi:hypothetical protein
MTTVGSQVNPIESGLDFFLKKIGYLVTYIKNMFNQVNLHTAIIQGTLFAKSYISEVDFL